MRLSRKMEHVRQALAIGQSGKQGLEDIDLVPNCIPGISLDDITLQTTIGELKLSSPIVINAMTGGAPETGRINRELAVAARETGVAMAVGSQMSALKNPELAHTYKIVRQTNPHGLIFANLGSEANVDQALRAIDMIEANALQIHLNVMQELIMPEGDRSFRGMLERIERIVAAAGVPVIVKEVGFGMTADSADLLRRSGVTVVDVGGYGGTNFAAIENARRDDPLVWLEGWGCTTSVSLLEVLRVFSRGQVVASGGIRSGLDAAKALALGASAVGMAGALLKVLQTEGTDALISTIQELEQHLKLIMTALGTVDIPALWTSPLVIGGRTATWCERRGIDMNNYARRSIRSGNPE